MKKKKRILRTVISTVLMCCMLVGDLGSVFATTVDNTEIVSEEVENKGTEQDVQTLSEPIKAPEVDIPAEQPAERLVQEPIEEPKVEVETPVVEEEVPPTEQPPVEETPVEKPQEEQPLEEPKVEPPVGDATVEEPGAGEVTPTESDNWSLDLVFYDSSVDGGKTPLKSIDWDASDGGYREGESRTITVQINYKNTNAVRTYQPGEVKISVPNITYNVSSSVSGNNKYLLKWNATASANSDSQTGYYWDLVNGIKERAQKIVFKNAVSFDKDSNFEGSIQIRYDFTPSTCFAGDHQYGQSNLELQETCTRNLSISLQSKLFTSNSSEPVVVSDIAQFAYRRLYNHPWKFYEYTYKLVKGYSLKSYDRLGVNASDYIWVRYQHDYYAGDFGTSGILHYPYVTSIEMRLSTKVPNSECVVLDSNFSKVTLSKDNVANVNYSYSLKGFHHGTRQLNCYIGYPKNFFNEEKNNLTINQSFDLYADYQYDDSSYILQGTKDVTINLKDFYIDASGSLYNLKKKVFANDSYHYTKFLLDKDFPDVGSEYRFNYSNIFKYNLESTALYSGRNMSVCMGDDLLYITSNSGGYRRLLDTEYYFKRVGTPEVYNGNDLDITNTCGLKLYVRYSGSTDYALYDKFDVNSYSTSFSKEDKVVGFYFATDVLSESISFDFDSASINIAVFPEGDILDSDKGHVVNSAYMIAYSESGEILNTFFGDNYIDGISDLEIINDIKDNDMLRYGNLISRVAAVSNYTNVFTGYPVSFKNRFFSGKENIVNDVKNEIYYGKSSVDSSIYMDLRDGYFSLNDDREEAFIQKVFVNYKDCYNYINSISAYTLLPKGMDITSSKSEIIDSIKATKGDFCYLSNGEKVDNYEELLKHNASVSIIKNWKGTGRSYLSVFVDLSSNTIVNFGGSIDMTFDYQWVISYEDIMSNGFSQTVYSYNESFLSNLKKVVSATNCRDNGEKDSDCVDVNNNGSFEDVLSYSSYNCIFESIQSSHQDVQTSVQTDKSNYSTGLVKAPPESEYSYKLRARSGSNQVSNLVLVNNLEEGYGDNEHWKGEFLGIDTSFAENRTYRVYKPSDPRADAEGYVQERVQVKPYYSTSTTEGELYQTEEKVITDPSGQQITQRIRVLDERGNFVKNPNWLEYSDSVDKGTVKSLAFEFLDAETGEQAILPENNLIYVEIKMKAPVEADGLTADGKAKYAYNNCFTQWNALDSMGQSVDFITGINSNTVKVTVNDRVSVQINKIWEDEENKYNTRPDTVEFVMKKDGAEVDRQTLEKGKTTVTFSGLLVDELSSYTFEEVCPSGYTTEGVIYDKVADTYTATNVLDPSSLVEINGTKTWVGDLESERPESITVNLYRNDVKIDSKVVRASDGWSYDFGKFIKNDLDGNKYVYRVEEEPIEGYIASYGFAENGLNIKFNSQCKTESANYDYVAIYYKGIDDKIYRLGMWGGTALAGKVVGVPSKDFWLYWKTDSSNSNYYGFSIDSIESANVEATGTVVRLPDYAVEEISGDTYPDSAFDGHTHGNYGNGVNKMWHYTIVEDGFNIVNTSNMTTIEGTKSWEGDTPEVRPDSITVNLLQDGKQFMSTTTNESKLWKYSFRVPKWDENGREYVYTVSEEPIDGYEASYYSGNGSKITFSADSRTESVSYDYVEIYYEKDGKTYKAGKWGGTEIAGTSVTIPSRDFYLYWRTDGSSCNYYGYRVESIVDTDYNDIIGTVATLPNYTVKDVQSINELQSVHNPYLNNENKLMLYHGNSGSGSMGRYDITNTLDNIELRFNKVFNTGTEGSKMELQHDGISFTLYENTLESGYPESFPGTSDEWRKVGELSKYEVGGDIGNFRSEYYIDGLKSNKEYFLVENTDNLRVTYYANLEGDLTDSFNVSTASIEDSCYVVRTGAGIIDNIFLTVYGYSNNTEYKPLYKENFRDFCLYYEGIVKGTKLHSFLDYISRKYPSIDLGNLFYLLQPEVYEGNWVISNFLETKRIGVTKKIKASDINFDNGNPTFIFEARVEDALGFSSKSSESELFKFPVLDIKHVEFTKEYVEANTDAEGYVSKTVYFDRIVPLSVMAVAERVGSRYDCSSVTVDGLDVSGIMSGMSCAEVFNTPFIETNITFTNEKYENQYYSHNSTVVNGIKRNKNKTSIAPPK